MRNALAYNGPPYINYSYAIGAVSGPDAGGVVGGCTSGCPTQISTYWDINTTGQSSDRSGSTGGSKAAQMLTRCAY